MTRAAPTGRTVELVAGTTRARLDLDRGARLDRLAVADPAGGAPLELVPADGPTPFGGGAFVMAPWAGRIRDAVAEHDGRRLALAPFVDGHAIHGLVLDAAWDAEQDAADHVRTTVRVDDGWFGPFTLTQDVRLAEGRLDVAFALTPTAAAIPATVGWHPWFARRLRDVEARLSLPAAWRLERDDRGIPDGRREVRAGAPGSDRWGDGPWDDAFGGLDGPVELRWPGLLALEVTTDGPIVVVYTGDPHAWCVEPQSGPPDEVHLAPRVVAADRPLTLALALAWRADTD